MMFKKSIAVCCLGFYISLGFSAEVYKYVDENGNIHYTDQKPTTEIGHDNLTQLTVLDSNQMNPKPTWQRVEKQKKQQAKGFEDFAIASPANGKTLSIIDGNLLVMVNLPEEITEKHRIRFYLNGIPHGKVKSATQLIPDIHKEGLYTLYAEVLDAQSRQVINTTPEIEFTIKLKH